MKHFTLLQLNKSIQKLISGIGQDFWIVAEIAQFQVSRHAYLDLVQKEEGAGVVAKARANIWQGQLMLLQQQLGRELLEGLLQPGAKVLMKVSVTFHEVHGLSLLIADIDPAYTLGEMERQRQESIQKLEAEGLLYRQRQYLLPLVPQRIAVVSSPDAAGYTDFMNQLEQNVYGYKFHTQLFPASVQGQKAEQEMVAQLSRIDPARFDAAVLIRGGGAKLDMVVFDSYRLAKAVAECPLPVLSGIGHQRDTSVCDMAAHTALKTPTAVAEFLIQRLLLFESEMQERMLKATQQAHLQVAQEWDLLRNRGQMLFRTAQRCLQQEELRLTGVQMGLQSMVSRFFDREKNRLDQAETRISLLDPRRVLARGFTLTYWEGLPVSSERAPTAGALLRTVGDGFEIGSIAIENAINKEKSAQ